DQYLGCGVRVRELRSELGARSRVHDNGVARLEANTLRQQRIDIAASGKRKHLEAIGMTSQDVQRAEADAAGGAQDGDFRARAHRNNPSLSRPTRNTGAAAVMLSTRSSTPPCPGSQFPLSFTPA